MVAPVRTRAEFSALSRSPHRGRSGPVWAVHVPDPDGLRAAVAYAVGRPVGTAVVRNRVRRRLRAVIRELDADGALAPGLHLVGARPDAVGLDFARLRHHVAEAVSRARPEPA